MKLLLKFAFATILIVGMTDRSHAQGIINMRFTNRVVSADGLHWTFDLEAKADPSYVAPLAYDWLSINVRLDLTLPAGVTILNGSGVGNPALVSGNASVQNSIPGGAPAGKRAMGVGLNRALGIADLTDTYQRLATFTVNFSGPVSPSDPAAPRPVPNQPGSSWVSRLTGDRRLIVFDDAEFSLPVKLISFDAVNEGRVTQLSWSTSEETNADRFEVERSKNGKNWAIIAKVAAVGESQSVSNYTAKDLSPSKGANLYRLKMIDRDGTSSYSKIQSLEFDGGSAISTYPNPVADMLNINASDFASVAQIQIFSMKGLEVYRSGLVPDKLINVKGLTAGMYVVKVTEKDDTVSSHKILVNK